MGQSGGGSGSAGGSLAHRELMHSCGPLPLSCSQKRARSSCAGQISVAAEQFATLRDRNEQLSVTRSPRNSKAEPSKQFQERSKVRIFLRRCDGQRMRDAIVNVFVLVVIVVIAIILAVVIVAMDVIVILVVIVVFVHHSLAENVEATQPHKPRPVNNRVVLLFAPRTAFLFYVLPGALSRGPRCACVCHLMRVCVEGP